MKGSRLSNRGAMGSGTPRSLLKNPFDHNNFVGTPWGQTSTLERERYWKYGYIIKTRDRLPMLSRDQPCYTVIAKFSADLATEQADETHARHSEPQHIQTRHRESRPPVEEDWAAGSLNS